MESVHPVQRGNEVRCLQRPWHMIDSIFTHSKQVLSARATLLIEICDFSKDELGICFGDTAQV
jgi:hypothetical protein